MIEPCNNSQIPLTNSEQQLDGEPLLIYKHKLSILNGKQLCTQAGDTTSFSPLSSGQQALWFLYQMAPESIAYNIFITVRIGSDLDLPAWHRVWQKICERHPILRTTYTTYEGKPVQLLHEQQEVYIQVTDASNWTSTGSSL